MSSYTKREYVHKCYQVTAAMYRKPTEWKNAEYSYSWNYHKILESKPRNKIPAFAALALFCIVMIVILVVLTNHKDGKLCVSGPMIVQEDEIQISFHCSLQRILLLC